MSDLPTRLRGQYGQWRYSGTELDVVWQTDALAEEAARRIEELEDREKLIKELGDKLANRLEVYNSDTAYPFPDEILQWRRIEWQ